MPTKEPKINQDAYFICRNFGHYQNVWYLGVCDGHGSNGHLVSDCLRNILPRIFAADIAIDHIELFDEAKNTIFAHDSVGISRRERNNGLLGGTKHSRAQLIKEGFANANSELSSKPFDTEFSGSTVISVFLIGTRLICANVGDSRAVLASLRTKPNNSKVWVATPLSRDHKPNLPDEHKRIIECDGRTEAFKG